MLRLHYHSWSRAVLLTQIHRRAAHWHCPFFFSITALNNLHMLRMMESNFKLPWNSFITNLFRVAHQRQAGLPRYRGSVQQMRVIRAVSLCNPQRRLSSQMRGSLELLSWLDQNVIDTVSDRESLIFQDGGKKSATCWAQIGKKMWGGSQPQMRHFDKITSGVLSKSHTAGPWKPLILWLLPCTVWLWLPMTFHGVPVFTSHQYLKYQGRLSSFLNSNGQSWPVWHETCMHSSRVICHSFFFFLFHSQVLGLADNIQSHLAFLVFLWTRDAMIEWLPH